MTARSGSRHILAAFSMAFALATFAQAATDDRAYLLGNDNVVETGVPGNPMGVNLGSGLVTADSQGPSQAFLDILVNGAPLYADVSDRPDGNGTVGGSFGGPGSGDYLSSPVTMNSPDFMWDNDLYFPSAQFALNYDTILSHGIQAWAKPNNTTARQDVVIDSDDNGIFITAGGNWGLQYDDGSIDSGVTVAFGQWTHVMEIAGFHDANGGRSNFQGALLVNGVAVAAGGSEYDADDEDPDIPLTIAGGAMGTNLYSGQLDDVRLFLWGDNSYADSGDGRLGQDWGELNLAVDNEWIAWQLADMGVTDRGDVDLSGGVPNAADVTAFVAGYNSERLIDDIRVGDWVSRQQGDLNYDGIVDLKDAFILNDSLIAGTGSGLDFGLLTGGSEVPEPASVTLLLAGLAGLGCVSKVGPFCRKGPSARRSYLKKVPLGKREFR